MIEIASGRYDDAPNAAVEGTPLPGTCVSKSTDSGLVKAIEEKDTLVLLIVGISVGARHQALNILRVKDIDFEDKVLQVYESKTSDYVLKFPPYAIFDLLKIYVEALNLNPEDKIFPSKYGFYLRRL